VSDPVFDLLTFLGFAVPPALGTYWYGRHLGKQRDIHKRQRGERRLWDGLDDPAMGLAVFAGFVASVWSSRPWRGVFYFIGFFVVAAAVLVVPLRIGYEKSVKARQTRRRLGQTPLDAGDGGSDEGTEE
jgi:hypothetical protein